MPEPTEEILWAPISRSVAEELEKGWSRPVRIACVISEDQTVQLIAEPVDDA